MVKPKKSVQKMKPYNPPIDGRKGMLRLDFNENTLGTSKKVVKAIRKATREDIAVYPEYVSFKKKLSKYLEVKPSQLVIANAGDEAIKLLIDTYVEKGEEIIIPVPTFPMFRFYGEIAGAKITEVLYNDDLSFPTEKVLNKISKKTKVVVLVNPNNPTGTPIQRKDIIKILKKAKNSIVLLDEAYVQFSGVTYKNLIRKYGNLVILQSFSKAFGLGGLRLGFLITNEKNAANLMKASSPYSVSTLAVIAGSAAIDDKAFVRKYVNEILKSKAYFLKELDKLGIKYYPSASNFVLINFGKKNNESAWKLKQKGILVRNQSEKPLLKCCTRITIGTRKQMKKVVEVLKQL